MATEQTFPGDELMDDSEPRLAVVLLLDDSSSMEGDNIDELNRDISGFCLDLKKDPVSSARCEIAVITFGGTANLVQPFEIAGRFTPQRLTAGGATQMAQGIELALETIEERKQIYRDCGLSYFRPLIIMVTDGLTSDPPEKLKKALETLNREEMARRVMLYALGTQDADFSMLSNIGWHRPFRLQKFGVADALRWPIGPSSCSIVTHSNEGVLLDVDPSDFLDY